MTELSARKPWTWKNVRLPKKVEEEFGRYFKLDIYRAHLEHEPESVEILMELGNLYTLTGQVREGLTVDERLVEINPGEPVFHYNLACSQSLLNEIDAALRSLERAIRLGYNNIEFLQEDADLENLRRDERFHLLLDSLRKRARREGEKLR